MLSEYTSPNRMKISILESSNELAVAQRTSSKPPVSNYIEATATRQVVLHGYKS